MNQIRFRSELRLDSGKLKTLRIPQTPYSAGEADTFSKASRSFPCLQRPPTFDACVSRWALRPVCGKVSVDLTSPFQIRS